MVLGLLAACAAPAPSPAEAASRACEEARAVPPIATPGLDEHLGDPKEYQSWVETLESAAGTGATAASGDSAYESLAAQLDVLRDDFTRVRQGADGGASLTPDERNAIDERITALVEACEVV